MRISLRRLLSGIGKPSHSPFGLWSSFGGRILPSLRSAIAGMSNPRVREWREVGTALHKPLENPQGVATNKIRWYVSSNGERNIIAHDNHVRRVYTPSVAIFEHMRADAGSPDD